MVGFKIAPILIQKLKPLVAGWRAAVHLKDVIWRAFLDRMSDPLLTVHTISALYTVYIATWPAIHGTMVELLEFREDWFWSYQTLIIIVRFWVGRGWWDFDEIWWDLMGIWSYQMFIVIVTFLVGRSWWDSDGILIIWNVHRHRHISSWKGLMG